MIEELNEGLPIVPRSRKLERDASKWTVLEVSNEEDPCVTFQAGTYTNRAGMVIPVIFKCYKSGMIYREWEKEARRRAAGGSIEEKQPYIDIDAEPVFEPIAKAVEARVILAPVVQMVDSQLEERQYRIGELRRKYAALDWGDPQKEEVLEELRALEKKILGDP